MRSMAVTVGALFLSLTLSGFAGTGKDGPKITMGQATATVMARHKGSIKSSELERERGKLVYSFDIQAGSDIREVQVDAMTGEIVEDKLESAADQAKEAEQEKHEKEQNCENENEQETEHENEHEGAADHR